MSDPWLDSIEKSLGNGDVPQRVTNRMVLAALRIMSVKMDAQAESCEVRGKKHGGRLSLLERWQSKANGAIAAAMFLGGGGLLITLLKLLGI